MTTSVLTAFNDHFFEFLNDIQSVFPDNVDVLTVKNSLIAVRKANPKLIVKIWNSTIVAKYRKEIEAGDISFFIDKDYMDDLSSSTNPDKIIEGINRLREPVRQMNKTDQEKTMKYIQNLTKLAMMCEQ